MFDRVSPALRSAEEEIDRAYTGNPLIGIDRAPALYNLLMAAEDALFIPALRRDFSPQQLRANTDSVINELRFPLSWIWRSNLHVGSSQYIENRRLFDAGYDLLSLAKNYEEFAGAFTLASAGAIRLHFDGTLIRPEDVKTADVRYEAYNRLYGTPRSLTSDEEVKRLFPDVAKHVRVRGGRFEINLPSKVFLRARRALTDHANSRFALPDNWEFSKYTLSEFKRVYGVLLTSAFIRAAARFIAANRGCGGLGVLDALEVRESREWIELVYRFTAIPRDTIKEILDDLTYGGEIRNPDPALQPLIPFGQDSLALQPMMFLSLDPERNLTVLLNRIPSERSIYSRIVGQKEDVMRDTLTDAARAPGLKTVVGPVQLAPDLPDVDIAFVSESEQLALICELKWFIEPAEAREILQKDEEIAKGVAQIEHLRTAINESAELKQRLGLNAETTVHGAVISKNWIGHSSPTANTPVINSDHFTHKLKSEPSLGAIVKWLNARAYLPVEGADFEKITTIHEVAGFKLEWYGIKPLTKGEFRPL